MRGYRRLQRQHALDVEFKTQTAIVGLRQFGDYADDAYVGPLPRQRQGIGETLFGAQRSPGEPAGETCRRRNATRQTLQRFPGRSPHQQRQQQRRCGQPRR